jgi:hypothetical protein
MTTIDRQVRVVTQGETANDDALSVAAVRELAWGMNNFKGLVSGQGLIASGSPLEVTHGGTGWMSSNAGTAEMCHHIFAPRPLPFGYDKIHFRIGGYTGTGTAVTWKLYASTRPYTGPATFDSSYLGPVWDVSTGITLTSSTHAVPAGVTDLEAVRNERGEVYLTLTSENASAGETCTLTALCAFAKATV